MFLKLLVNISEINSKHKYLKNNIESEVKHNGNKILENN